MSIIKILEDSQRKEFDKPPKFSYPQRKIMFSLPEWAAIEFKTMISSINKIGFIFQLGYFKASGRFFKTETYSKEDFLFINRIYKCSVEDLDTFKLIYDKVDSHRHRQIILENFGISSFDEKQKEMLYQEAIRLSKKQANHRSVFYSLASYLRSHKIEVPAYFSIASILTEAIRKRDSNLITIIQQNLNPELQNIFDKMVAINEESNEKRYLLTQLKRSRELMKPNAIRANIKDYKALKGYYQQIKPILPLLDISDEMVQYYAQFVIRSQIFQVSRRENRYLMLLCFIVYQYRFLGDLLVDTFLRAAQQFENAAQRASKEAIYQNHLANQSTLEQLFDMMSQMIDSVTKVETITLDFGKTNDEKAKYWVEWVNSETFLKFKNSKKEVDKLRKGGHIKKDDAYYQILEEKSRVLQFRVSDILRHLDFECNDANLKRALDEFKQKDGNVGPDKFSDGFLKKQEKEILKRSKNATSLYKVMLTQNVANHIKSGQIALTESINYKTFESYLIDEYFWKNNKNELLKQYNLEWMKDWNIIETQLKNSLSMAFETTFSRINTGKNDFVHKRKDGKPRFTEPNTEDIEMEWDLFPKEGSISIIEVLNTIQRKTNFTETLQHFSLKNQSQRPDNSLFFAGVLAYGCNIGLGAMARNSPAISANSLENTANWYFSLGNLQRANDKIIAFLDKLKIGELFKNDPSFLHTSSDGQKILVQVDSIHANYSYKYFGKDKGIVIYSFIDELHRLFHSLTISSSEREALYVLEGLLQNQVVQSDMHSTDTHGTNGINFALMFLAGIRFIPRIEDFQNQNFYCFPQMQIPLLLDYELKVGKTINTTVIENNWDMVCRMMVTFLSKHCSASTLIKRLGSYEQQHPVLQALKELDKIIKTKFLLEYMDGVTLRQIVQKQLNKGENANKFSSAVNWGNNGEIKFASKAEQLLADVCRRLIQNIIIAWNYLYMGNFVIKANQKERNTLIKTIQESSPVHWQHINLHGTFDFSNEALVDALDFDVEELINFEWKI
jgi:TnpA family transposase